MRRSWLRVLILFGPFLLVLGSPSCGYDQQLVSIGVSPKNTTIIGAGLQLQFIALGSYIHPPESKDITTTVMWKSDAEQIISFSPDTPGLAISGTGCGTNIGISAIIYSNPSNPSAGTAVIGRTTVSVTQPNDPNCP